MRDPAAILLRLRRVRARANSMIDRWYYRVPARATEPYATHLPVLICLARIRKIRRILELGAGTHSTLTFLDRAAFPDLDTLHSLETNASWAERVQTAAGDERRMTLTLVAGTMASALSTIDVDAYDLIFVDDSERRATIAQLVRCRPRSAIVVVHDFENPAYRAAARGFAHRYRFAALNPNVGVLSNTRFDTRDLDRLTHVVAESRDRIATSSRHEWCELMNVAFGTARGS